MKQIGRKIYFENNTGNVILETSEMIGHVIETTTEQDIANFTALAERQRDSFNVIKLEYGQFNEDFRTCNGYRVNVITKELEFSYPTTEQPQEPVYVEPLTVQVEKLKTENAQLNTQLIDLWELLISGGVI